MSQATATPRPKPIPLWMILLSCATIAAIGMGIRQSMGLYLKPVSMDLGLGRDAFSLAIGVANIIWGIAAPFTGAIADKYGTGRVVLFGTICTVAGLLVLNAATSELHLMISGVLLGFGVAGAGINAMVGAVGRAARPEDRSSAVAFVGMGSGIGMLVAIPYVQALIGVMGWQSSLLVVAATAFLMLPLAWSISGKPAVVESDEKPQSLGEALKEAFAHPSFWLLNAGFFVCGFHVVFYATHLPAYVSDIGLAPWVAVTGLIGVGLGNLVGTYLSGQWGKRYSKRYGLTLIYLARAIIFIGFLYLPISEWMVVAMSFGLGLFWLSTIPLTSSLVATFFGPVWMTMLYGIVFFSHQLGSFLGVYMAGVLFDMTKSYDAMWWISAGLGVFAALIHIPIKEAPVARLANRQPAAA
jgi:predicted MFS family arabinose efflux permease